MAADSPLAASCRSVVQIYETASGPVHALRGLTLDASVGAVTAVIGPSGAGKSTLLRLLACLEPPSVGEVTVGGTPTSHLGGRARRRLAAAQVGYVFQTPGDNLFHDLTVIEHVAVAGRMRVPRRPPDPRPLLETFDLEALAGARPGELAVGEQQRLAFAMAVAGDPALVVADEPTASLDPDSAELLVGVLASLARAGQAMVISTHDPLVVDAADRVLVIRNGTLAMEARGGGDLLSVLDDTGRLSLPPAADELLVDRRARVTVDGDQIRVDPP